MAFVFAWLRLNGNRLLDWQRCFSYQPRDITWAQQQVSHWHKIVVLAGHLAS